MAKAQFDNEVVFPGMEGEALLEEVINAYKPLTVLTYGQSRDTLFSNILAKNDSLECVYTGHKLYLDPNEDPTVFVYMDGIDDGINTEHTYPRSKGAENGNARSDMHHLFPTRIRVNSDRGNLPFGEIPDENTNKWYYKNQTIGSIPSQNIDLYSEGVGTSFEPKEAHKGNVARAMFYFYTMYKDQADAADPDFFPAQISTLCAWHFLDPVDELEWNSTMKIANYQDGKPNPFVLDCTLAGRTYCDFIAEACTVVNTEELDESPTIDINISPNPSHELLHVDLGEFKGVLKQIDLISLTGELISSCVYNDTQGNQQNIDISNCNKGIYILKIIVINNGFPNYISKRIVIQ